MNGKEITINDRLRIYNKNKVWKLLYVVISTLIIGWLSTSSQSTAGAAAFGLIVVGLAVDQCMPFCIYLICSVLNISFETSLTALGSQFILLLLSIQMISNSKTMKTKTGTVALLLILSLVLSFLFGPNSSFKILFNIVLTLLVFFSFGTFYMQGKETYIIVSLITVGLFVGISTWLGFRSGSAEMLQDIKLSYRENIRTLANACAFPFVYCTCMLIQSISNNTFIKKWWILAVSLLLGFLLINSYSRGALIASISAVVIYAILVNRRAKFSNKLLIFLILAGFAALAAGVNIASDTMYDDTSMIARSELWAYLFSETTNSPLTVLFGLGTCNIKDYLDNTPLSGLYTHSLILDYYFCYGLCGFLTFIYLLIYILSRLLKNNQSFMVSVFVLAVLMFFSHGTSTSLLFYGLMGMCLGRINCYQNKRIFL